MEPLASASDDDANLSARCLRKDSSLGVPQALEALPRDSSTE